MSKDVINVNGEDRVVREDTAKSYRGTIWALLSVAAFVIIAAVIFLVFFTGSVSEGNVKSPRTIEQQRR